MLQSRTPDSGHGREQEPLPTKKSIEDLITKYRESGSFDLREASFEDTQELMIWFTENFDEIPRNMQTELFEQLLAQDFFVSSEALEFLLQMNDKQKAQVGEFIADTLPPKNYTRLFHHCWDSLSEDLRGKYTHRYIHEEPESSYLIAPFVNLDLVLLHTETNEPIELESDSHYEEFVKTKKESYEKPERMDKYHTYKNMVFSAAKNSGLLTVSEHGNMQNTFENFARVHAAHFDEKTHLFESTLQAYEDGISKDALPIRGLIDLFSKTRYHSYDLFLLPYLPKLIKLELITEDFAKNLLNLKQKHPGFFFSNDYLTQSQKEQREELLDELVGEPLASEISKYRTVESWKRDKRMNLLHSSIDELKPHHTGIAFIELEERASTRGAEHVLKNFDEYSKYSDQNKVTLLSDLLEQQTPIFSMIEDLNLSEDEIQEIFFQSKQRGESIFRQKDLSDSVEFLKWGASHDKQAFAERLFLQSMVSELQGDGNWKDHIVHFIEKLTDVLSEDAKTKLFRLINSYAPQIWLDRIDYVLEHRPIALKTLLSAAAADGRHYVWNYHFVLFHQKRLERMDPAEREQRYPGAYEEFQDTQTTVKEIFEKQPDLFVECDQARNELYSQEEQDVFIRKVFAENPTDEFLTDILFNDVFKKTYSKEIRKVFLDNPERLAEQIEWRDDVKSLLEHLTEDELFTTVLEQISLFSREKIMETLFEGETFLLWLIKNPEQFQALTESLESIDKLDYLSIVLSNMRRMIEHQNKMADYISSFEKLNNRPATKEEREERGLSLKGREFNQLKTLQEEAWHTIQKAIDENPNFVFREKIIGIKDEVVTKAIRENIADYAKIYPEALITYNDEIRAAIEEAEEDMGEEIEDHYTPLFQTHFRAMLFAKEREGYYTLDDKYIPYDSSIDSELNPLLDIYQGRDDDFEDGIYSTVMKRVEKNPFLSIYKDELEKIVAQEKEKWGEQKNRNHFEMNDDFQKLIERISLLNLSPLAEQLRKQISTLPENTQEEYLLMLEYMSYYNLDSEVITTDQTLEQIKEQMDHLVRDHIRQTFEMPDLEIEAFSVFDTQTLRALITYYKGACDSWIEVKPPFRIFLQEVAKGNYSDWRAWGNAEGNSVEERQAQLNSLKESNLVPKNISLDQYESWSNDTDMDFSEALDLNIRDVQSSVVGIYNDAAADHHILRSETERESLEILTQTHRSLLAPTETWGKRMKELKISAQTRKGTKAGWMTELSEAERAEYDHLKSVSAEYRESNENELTRTEVFLYLTKLKTIQTRELEGRTLIIDKREIPLARVFKTLNRYYAEMNPAFLPDINRLQKTLQTSYEKMFGGYKATKKQYTLTDKVNLNTYFRIGEKPVTSCQHYASDNEYNAGLLSYVVDPNVKIIQMHNENNEIIARSILRVLEDKNGDPQLFIERVYTDHVHHKIKEAMVNFAKKKAEQMGVGLYSHAAEDLVNLPDLLEGTPKNLESKASRNAYVYTDAGGGKVRNGAYQIRGAVQIV